MCLFPKPNFDIHGEAYRRGITEFECGECPECLSKRARYWALRSSCAASEYVDNCMCTLTYDNFERDRAGRIVGELPVDRTLTVCKRDIQLFVKRLRKWYSSATGKKLKYLISAEYGSRTHRAHYHCLFFNVRFPDLVPYKKSKRGNYLYMSKTLTSIWGHGICTVDSIHLNSATAAYCTKYCAKSRCDDTFMLFSQGIGDAELMRRFNGRSYIIEGREYPIPKIIWQRVIMDKYPEYDLSNRYRDITHPDYELSKIRRHCLTAVMRSDSEFCAYLDYWKDKADTFNALRLPPVERVRQLDNQKYFRFKARALEALSLRERGIYTVCPYSRAEARAEARRLSFYSCHKTTSDTERLKNKAIEWSVDLPLSNYLIDEPYIPPDFWHQVDLKDIFL